MAQDVLDDILSDCLDRLQQGETIETCLALHPGQADELRSLLETAATVHSVRFAPSISYRAASRLRFQGAVRAKLSRQTSRGRWWGDLPMWTRAWSGMAAALLLTIGLGGGAIFASSDAGPDSVLYPIKRASERARIALTPSGESRAQLYLQYADKRGKEIVVTAQKGDAKGVEKLQQDFVWHINLALVEHGISLDEVIVPQGEGPVAMAQAGVMAEAAPTGPSLAGAPAPRETAHIVASPEVQAAADKATPTQQPRARAVADATPRVTPSVSPEEAKNRAFLHAVKERCEKNVARLTLALQQASPHVKGTVTRVLERACQSYALGEAPADFAKRVLLIQGVATKTQGNKLAVGGRRIEMAPQAQVQGGEPEVGRVVIVGGLLQGDGSILALSVDSRKEALSKKEKETIIVQGPLLQNEEATYMVGGYLLKASRSETKIDSGLEQAELVQVTGKVETPNEINALEIKVLDAPGPLSTHED